MEQRYLAKGRYLHLVENDVWEWVDKPDGIDAVCILATDMTDQLILIEQYRYPLRARCIELPAGLVGDVPGEGDETILDAARRELEEETGYASDTWDILCVGASSAGMTSECPTIARAKRCTRVSAGGGVDDEDIEVHIVPLGSAEIWVAERQAAGCAIDIKVWLGIAAAKGAIFGNA